jgi:hypothetical protein
MHQRSACSVSSELSHARAIRRPCDGILFGLDKQMPLLQPV